MFLCPNCNTPLGELRRGGVFEEICPKCRYQYQVLVGRLAARNVRSVTRRAPTAQDRGHFTRAYELRLELSPTRHEAVDFEVPERDDTLVHVERGDTVAVVYAMRDWRRDELLQVRNYTTGEIFEIARPGATARNRAGCAAIGVGLLTFIALIQVAPSSPVLVITPLAVTWGAYALLARLFAPTHRWAATREPASGAAPTLLEQIHALAEQRATVEADREEKLALRERLVALQRKMREVDLPAYAPRIAALERAVAAVDEQIALDERLRDGYDRSIKILEIEHESGATAERLSADVSATMQAKLDELRMLEEQHAELGRLLEANAELERFLRDGRA